MGKKTALSINAEEIAQGKTKIIYRPLGSYGIAIIKHKPQLTAGDGKKKDLLENKDIYANQTTCNVFNLLNQDRIATHFLSKVSDNMMLVKECRMVPFEVVVRRVILPQSSYLKRHPEIKEGTVFTPLMVEFFLKDDKRHDPIIEFTKNQVHILDAKKPLISSDSYLGCEGGLSSFGLTAEYIEEIKKIAMNTFLVIEGAFKNQGVTLIDLKIEFGFTDDGKLVIADVIDNDSWRIEYEGKFLDKQSYRDSSLSMKQIGENYALVAQITNNFI